MIFRLGLLIVILILVIVFVVGIIDIIKTYIRYRNIKKEILLELEIINKCNYSCKDKVNTIVSKNHLIQ